MTETDFNENEPGTENILFGKITVARESLARAQKVVNGRDLESTRDLVKFATLKDKLNACIGLYNQQIETTSADELLNELSKIIQELDSIK